MINIVFIAYEFPPLKFGGVFRSLAFVKYLPEYGINPIVVTLSKQSYEDLYPEVPSDYKLGAETISKTNLVEVKSVVPRKKLNKVRSFINIYFNIHGKEADYWRDDFNNKLDEIINQYSPQLIYVTVPPFSMLKLASAAAEKHQLPLIMDFRDAWSQWRTVPYGSYFHYLMNLKYEKNYLRQAAAVVATSKQTIVDFQQLYPSLPANKLHYVPNGYDGKMEEWQAVDLLKKEFVIGYVGSFYYNPESREQMLKPWYRKKGHRMLQYIPQKQDWLYRSPYFFFQALKALFTKSPEWKERIKVRFAGRKPEWLVKMINDFFLNEVVELIGEISHSESLAFQKKCDALLITSSKRLNGKDYSIAGKTFEYFQMQRPILAFVCEGAQKEILAASGAALICNPDETLQNAEKLKNLFIGNMVLQPDKNFLGGLSRSELTSQLANIIQSVKKK